MYELMVVQKDFKKAWELYLRLRPLMDLFESSGQYVQLAKAGLEMMGHSIGLPRKPLLPPSDELVASLKGIMDTLE
jgi:dihydrodipicolinate synthase/N-acetylneuraminate lyase